MSSHGLLNAVDRPKTAPAQLTHQRNYVSQQLLRDSAFLKQSSFKRIATTDLQLLFDLIDQHYFGGACGREIANSQSQLSFRLSKRMTSCGGTTTMEVSQSKGSQRKTFEIAVATTLLFDTFRLKTSAKVGGLSCRSPLDALTRIMEHEMVHLIELLLWDDSNCSAKRFQQISWRRFGHLESNHQLMTPSDVAKSSFGIRAGDHVTFRFDGKQHTGWVNRITKRATVLVNDPRGMLYNDGHRYHKFYVPVSQLKKIG